MTMKKLWFTLALCLAIATTAFAQVQSGTVTGSVPDEQGGVLPGVTVTIVGNDRTATFVTEADGKYRFLNLPPGTYRMTAELTGFSTVVREDVVVIVGQTVDLTDQPEGRDRAGDRHRHRRVADRRHASDRHGDQLHAGGAREDSDLARSVGADAHGAGRPRRPREHRRQRDRPAVELRVEGHAPGRRGLDDGRRRHHRHGGDRRVADLLQLRQLRGDPGLDRRPGHQAADRRRRPQLRRQARHQPVPGGVRAATSRTTTSKDRTSRRARGAGVTPETADHNEQISDYGFDLGGPIVSDKRVVLRLVVDAGHPPRPLAGNLIDRTILKNTNVKGNWQATTKDMVSVLWFLGRRRSTGARPASASLIEAPTATWDPGRLLRGRPGRTG